MANTEDQTSPYHAGEIGVQAQAGVREAAMRGARRSIRDHMLDQHREFFGLLPYIFVGAIDRMGRPWASVITGSPGFVQSPDPKTLKLAALPPAGDPVRDGLRTESPVSVVGVEFHSRRRNRLNGRIARLDQTSFEISVDQSYGNCPQYIQARQPPGKGTSLAGQVRRLDGMDEAAYRIIESADTCFIASVSADVASKDPNQGVDINHRGGRPGFLKLERSDKLTRITFPDFVGNFFFNTLGNIAANPTAGLFIPDFKSGSAISLTGAARVIWGGEHLQSFAGAERLVEITVEEVYQLENVLPKDWSEPLSASQLAETGTWQETEEAVRLREQANRPIRLRVENVTEECEGVRSFELVPEQARSLPTFQPGQFLPLIVERGPGRRPLRAVYSLSRSANMRSYRISVARSLAGRSDSSSGWLHDNLKVGSSLEALSPRGSFVLDANSKRTVLLIAGGIGITPLFAMMDHLTGGTPDRCRFPDRTVILIHAVRNGSCHPLKREILDRARLRDTFFPLFAYSAPNYYDKQNGGFEVAGRLNRQALRALLPLDDYDVYLCGSPAFMQNIYGALRSLGVPDARIRAESFGPSSLQRSKETGRVAEQANAPAVQSARIHFARSKVDGSWTGAHSLLELAESLGIDAPYGCRSGKCGECEVPLLSGQVGYDVNVGRHEDRSALICCAYPTEDDLTLDL